MTSNTSYDLRGPILILAAAVLLHGYVVGSSGDLDTIGILGALVGLVGILFTLAPVFIGDGRPPAAR